ncbi:MAG: M20 family metallo-hydrolase [Oscillospiraceae bacterium]|nr:M20 family metallo-hydrolase [Oscillospiraceae bacterium]
MDKQVTSTRIQKDMELFEPFTQTPGQGITRLPFSIEVRKCVDVLTKRMERAGLTVREDVAGNLIGRLEGSEPDAPALVIGSHFDSVKSGGNFDGMAGIIVGIEIVRMLRDSGTKLRNPIEIMGTHDEEGMRFGTGFFGTKAMMGEIDDEYLLRLKDSDGVSLYDAMICYGLSPDKIKDAARDYQKEIAAFIEVHIEQGPVLENSGTQLGLVNSIVGMQRYLVTVTGRPDHAGTTPMDMRIDAMECASKLISRMSDWAKEAGGEGTVATVGFVQAAPNAMNIIAQEVIFSVDVRSKEACRIDQIVGNMCAELEAVCSEKGATFKIDEKLKVPPASLDEKLLAMLAKSCCKLGLSHMHMPSGAGHDSLQTAPKIDTAMVFVPSKNGRSHCPEEWTEYSDLANAAHLVYDTLVSNYTHSTSKEAHF